MTIEWAAGVYEGEGSATRCDGRIRLALKMTNEEVVWRFACVLGFGIVYGPYVFEAKDGFRRKPFWMWVAEGEEAWEAADLLSPWLSEARMGQIDRVFGESERIEP